MSKKRGLTEDERKLWKALTKDIKPLKKETPEEEPEAPEPSRKKIKVSRPVPCPAPAPPPSSGAADKETIARLRRGEYAISSRIDLHGYTLEEAYEKLTAFIENGYHRKKRCLLVITGKSGQMAREVPRWLQHSGLSRMILVVSSAQPKHGGQGAYYLLLRRNHT